MSVDINPSHTLGFNRPLTSAVKRSLSVYNPNAQPVVFKVKTTAPKQYSVRPNAGIIEPGTNVDVQILLQPLKEDPPPDSKCRDKFLVQSSLIPAQLEGREPVSIWQSIERDAPESVVAAKIRCAYLPAEESNNVAQPVRSNSGPGSNLLAPSHDNNRSEGLRKRGSASPGPIKEDNSLNGTFDADYTAMSHDSSQLPPNNNPNTFSNASMRSTNITPVGTQQQHHHHQQPQQQQQVTSPSSATSSRNVENEIQQLRQEIAQLRSDNTNLNEKLRKGSASSTSSTNSASKGNSNSAPTTTTTTASPPKQTMARDPPSEGVPIQVVAAIALGVFILTWAFF